MFETNARVASLANPYLASELGARIGRGCAELNDRMMVGLRVPRIECDRN
jgi:hypothetical protein